MSVLIAPGNVGCPPEETPPGGYTTPWRIDPATGGWWLPTPPDTTGRQFWAPYLVSMGGSSPNIGSAPVRNGTYHVVDGMVFITECGLSFGGSGISAGTGPYALVLPVAPSAAAIANNAHVGTWKLYNPTLGFITFGVLYLTTPAGLAGLQYAAGTPPNGTITQVGANLPDVPVAGWDLRVWFSPYEAA